LAFSPGWYFPRTTLSDRWTPIDRVIGEGAIIQIVPDGRVITFIHEDGVYTAVYSEGSELLVGEYYFLTAIGDLLPASRYRAKE
jgi:hypothetical protein